MQWPFDYKSDSEFPLMTFRIISYTHWSDTDNKSSLFINKISDSTADNKPPVH